MCHSIWNTRKAVLLFYSYCQALHIYINLMNCHCQRIVPDLPAPYFHCTLTPSSSNDNGQLRRKALKIPATLLCEGHNSFDGSFQTGFVAWKDLSVYMNNKKISTTFHTLSRHLCWQHASGFGVTKMMRDNIEMASISETLEMWKGFIEII